MQFVICKTGTNFPLDKPVLISYSKEVINAATKRSTHYPLSERRAVPAGEISGEAARPFEGRSAEGSFRAGDLNGLERTQVGNMLTA